MKSVFLVIALVITSVTFAQNQQLVDSLSNEICISITSSKEANDSTRVFDAFKQHNLPPHPILPKKKRTKLETIFISGCKEIAPFLKRC